MGEVFYCQPLFERDDRLQRLKARAASYPPPLKTALIAGLWEAGFSLDNARKPAARGDVVQVVGCLYRAVAVMVQALFALDERYCINEKGAAKEVDGFRLRPRRFHERVSTSLAAPGRTALALTQTITDLEALLGEVQALCDQ